MCENASGFLIQFMLNIMYMHRAGDMINNGGNSIMIISLTTMLL